LPETLGADDFGCPASGLNRRAPPAAVWSGVVTQFWPPANRSLATYITISRGSEVGGGSLVPPSAGSSVVSSFAIPGGALMYVLLESTT
jgi:hypothetical protein